MTGASRGVGKGVALALAEAGWTVYLTGRGRPAGSASTATGARTASGPAGGSATAKPTTGTADGPAGGSATDPLTAAAAEATARGAASGGRGVAVVCDHRDDAQIMALFDRVDADAGRLDLLVNNVWAGPPFGGADRFWQRPLSDWDTLIGVGLRAHYVASVLATGRMLAHDAGGGLIVNISSFGTRRHLHSVLYGMSKAGLDKMTADMAVELDGRDVTVLSLWLGLVQTERVLSAGVADIGGFPIAEAETPEFAGRVIAALAADPRIGRLSGQTVISAEIAADYGVTEPGGGLPRSHRDAFGGGPVFPVP